MDELNKLYRINLHKINQNERKIKYGLFDRKEASASQLGVIHGNKLVSFRSAKSQVKESYANKFQRNTFKRRDLSAVNSRGFGSKAYGTNLNSSYINSSMDTSSSRIYGLANNRSSNQQKNIKNTKKMRKEPNNINIKKAVEESTTSKQDNSELRELKGLKIGEKKKIETSVNL